jgi:hypothetical protein
MGAHAFGAAAYAAKAAGLAAHDRPEAVSEEVCWQLGHMSAAARAALRQLPRIGENSSGPLGPGLLASGLLGTIIRDLQTSLAAQPPAITSTTSSVTICATGTCSPNPLTDRRLPVVPPAPGSGARLGGAAQTPRGGRRRP